MKILIAYSTKYGSVEKCAEFLKKELVHDVQLYNVKTKLTVNIDEYDMVLLGGSVYIGKTQKELTNFLKKHESALLKKQLGLFICCGAEDRSDTYMKDIFTEAIYNHASAKAYTGYAYYLEKMSFIEKAMIKKMVKINHNVEDIKYENITAFVEKIKKL